ncbi:MAG: hypothetical protein AAF449_00525 [Myxococcota bacterium]
MRVLIDPSETRLPKDIVDYNEKLRAETEAAADVTASQENRQLESASRPSTGRQVKSTPRLDRWDLQIHAYKEREAGEVSLLSNLFGGETARVRAGVVHDAKWFRIGSTDSRNVEIGVAIWLSVATSSFDANIGLTLPNLAASAQLSQIDARVGITVLGYAGALGDYLPAPSKLDVESCVEYLNAFRSIQKLIFGQEGLAGIAPTVLSYELPDAERDSLRHADL